MFQPCTRPFAEVADSLYLPASFQPPPAGVAAPERPHDWLYFEPEAWREAGGFEAFLRSPEFDALCEQIQARVHSCIDFARLHATPGEAAHVRDDLTSFLQHLCHGRGSYFSNGRLQMLCTLGKQALDDFSLLLQEPTIELGQRLRALREMSVQASMCMGAGPAFMNALEEVMQPAGTLRGQYWCVLKEMLDQSIQQHVATLCADKGPQWNQTMETHVVNRMRLELGLPGARPEDDFSYFSWITPVHVQACANALLHHCRPVQVAYVMAARYRAQVQDMASQQLQIPAAGLDLNDELHMDAVLRAVRHLAPTYPGVSHHSLMTMDPDNGDFRWVLDDALLARELLLALSAQQLIRPPVIQTAVRGSLPDGTRWAVHHIDERLPYVRELRAGANPEQAVLPLRAVHLAPLMRRSRSEPLREAGLQAVLRGEPVEALRHIPPSALPQVAQLAALLDRLGPEAMLQWVRNQQFEASEVVTLLIVATAISEDTLLRGLIPALIDMGAQQVLLDNGGPMLEWAALRNRAPALQRWGDLLLFHLDGGQHWPFLREGADSWHFMSNVLMSGQLDTLDLLLDLMRKVAQRMQPPSPVLMQWFKAPLSKAMQAGRLEALRAWQHHVEQLVEARLLDRHEVRDLLDAELGARGCLGAMNAGQSQLVQWLQSMLSKWANAGVLDPLDVAQYFCGQFEEDILATGVYLPYPDCLRAYLDALVRMAQQHHVEVERLQRLLVKARKEPFDMVATMMARADARFSDAWVDAVIELVRGDLLTPEWVGHALSRRALRGHPSQLMNFRTLTTVLSPSWSLGPQHRPLQLLPPEHQLHHWTRSVVRLCQSGALAPDKARFLIEGTFARVPAMRATLLRGDAEHSVLSQIEMLSAMRKNGLIDDAALAHLLLGRDAQGGPDRSFSVAESRMAAVWRPAVYAALSHDRLPWSVLPLLAEAFPSSSTSPPGPPPSAERP